MFIFNLLCFNVKLLLELYTNEVISAYVIIHVLVYEQQERHRRFDSLEYNNEEKHFI